MILGRAPKTSARKSAKSDFRAKIAEFDAAFAVANRQISTKKNSCDSAAVLESACDFLRKSVLKSGTDMPSLAEDEIAGVVVLALAACKCIKSRAPSDAVGYLRRAMAVQPNHLLLQELLRQATGKKDPPDLKLRFCAAPFENIETEPGGSVSFCCPAWLPVPIGNLNESSPDDIWNSKNAQDIRASILDGTYRYCSRTHCPKFSAGSLPKTSNLSKSKLRDIAAKKRTHLACGPSNIVLSHDRSCTLSCPSCRTQVILAKKKAQKALNDMADTVIYPLLKNAERVRITGSGDPFGSAHFQYVIRNLDRANNPKLRLDLQTNGVLLTPALWDRLKLEGRVDTLIVSVDATRPKTYTVVRRGGDFDTLRRNLDFFAGLRRDDRIAKFRLDFVVQALNFREMPEFVHLARRLGCDGVKFQMIRGWGTYSPAEFARVDIGDPAHPEHSDFQKTIGRPELTTPYVEIWGMGVVN